MIANKKSLFQELRAQGFEKFRKVRECHNALWGQYQLYSHNRKKYIGKELPQTFQFCTTRNNPEGCIYRYSRKGLTLYLFPLIGDPLTSWGASHEGYSEIKNWVCRMGGEEGALWEIVRIALKYLDEFKGAKDILLECFRVYNGHLYYQYDTWMNRSEAIVQDNYYDIQRYFFSHEDLSSFSHRKALPKQYQQAPYEPSHGSLVYRIFLLVLSLGTHQLKSRLYEYEQFRINAKNLEERLTMFMLRFNSKGLGNLLKRIIEGGTLSMEEIWKITALQVQGAHSRASRGKPQGRKRVVSLLEKQNYLNTSISNYSSYKKREPLEASCTQPSNFSPFEKPDKRKLLLRPDHKKKPSLHEHSLLLSEKLIALKNLPALTLLRALQLDEWVPIDSYQTNILKCLGKINIKDIWTKKTYDNGSVYLGQLSNFKSNENGSHEQTRTGKGLYVFASEDVYYGDWKHNAMNGYGVYIFKSGEMYEGHLENGSKQGFGKFTYSDGRQYEGYWSKDLKCGLGTVKFTNGIIFMGMFNPRNSNHTEGIFIDTFNTCQTFSGVLETYHERPLKCSQKEQEKKCKLSKCNLDRFGKIVGQNGEVYEGELENGIKNGFGIQECKDEIYQGLWSNNQRNGPGKLIIRGNLQIEGIWENGIMVQIKSHSDS